MRIATVRSFVSDIRGAIAPIFALALFGLVAMGTVGFDYGRLMTLNSELQSAADQAALAAATQLDGKPDSITRAQSAANTYFATATSAYVNETRVAQDGGGANAITSLSFAFYSDYTSDAPVGSALSTSTADQAAAKVVKVTVNNRRITKPLTPITNALLTANSGASAMARVDGATCNVPPLMICTPTGATDFPIGYEGKGVLLEPGGQTGAWAPGAFGYLDLANGPGSNGANALRDLLGSASLQNQCRSSSSTVDAATGNKTSATDVINTTFDMYPNGSGTNYTCKSNGDFCPSSNTRKDQTRLEEHTYKKWGNSTAAPPTRPACNKALANSTGNANPSINVGTGWDFQPSVATAHLQGHPRDNCHYSNNCGGVADAKYGDGVWNATAYFNAVHGIAVPGGVTTRYQAFLWEKDTANPARLNGVLANSTAAVTISGCNGGGNNCDFKWTNYCAYPTALYGTAAVPTGKDRRILTVAAVDCSQGANTGSNHSFYLKRWVDIFLVEPSLNRNAGSLGVTQGTSQSQIYGEIVGLAKKADGTSGFQYYGRNKAVLIR